MTKRGSFYFPMEMSLRDMNCKKQGAELVWGLCGNMHLIS